MGDNRNSGRISLRGGGGSEMMTDRYSTQLEYDESHPTSGRAQNFDRHMIDRSSKGLQILREYVNYYNYNFYTACMACDPNDRQVITKEDFRSILNNSRPDFYFTAENIEEILSDAPHQFDGKEYYILYADLFNLITTYPPKTKHSLANIFGLRKKNPQDHQVDVWEKEIERLRKNFWDRRDPNEVWDFQCTDLDRLETTILQSKRDEQGNILTVDEEDTQTRLNNINANLTENDIYERGVKKLYQMNNETILKNFDTRISTQIAKISRPPGATQVTNDQVEKIIQLNFQPNQRSQNKILKQFFEEDFRIIMREHYEDIKLTDDECDLLFYRIWEDNNFGCFTFVTFAKWVNKNRHSKLRELRVIGLTDGEQKRILNKEASSSPKLFKELVKYAYSFGLNFLMTSLKPIIERENYVVLSNLYLYFKSLNITFNQSDINDLKFYLANNGAIHLQDNNNLGFMNADLLLDATKLIDLITKEAQKIAMHTINYKDIGKRSKEQSRRSVQSKIVQGVVQKLSLKLKPYTDDNDLIEEIKLRKTVADSFSEIDQIDLDLIFSKLQNVTQPSKYASQRKIYLPEFLDFLLGGPLFNDDMFKRITDYEAEQKLIRMGIQVNPPATERTYTDQSVASNQPSLDINLINNGNNSSIAPDTARTTSDLPSIRFKTNPTPQAGAGPFIYTEDQASIHTQQQQQQQQQQQPQQQLQQQSQQQQKFTVITKESLQQQLLNQQGKSQTKTKRFSEAQVDKSAEIKSLEKDEEAETALDDTWKPDYRKIAADELQGVRTQAGINYMKGGFILEEKSEAFAAKPINDRAVICKLYESLKSRVLVGKYADLVDFDAVDIVMLKFRHKLAVVDPTLRGVITSQQFYSFIKLNFLEFSQQECYQLRHIAESYAGTQGEFNEYEKNISYTYFCMHLHKFICQNVLLSIPTSHQQQKIR